MDHFEGLWAQARIAFKQNRTAQRARKIAYGALTCLGRHTLTGMLTASGHQFVDWSAAYRLFGHSRMDIDHIFKVARQGVLQEIGDQEPLVAHIDDTILRKRGRNIHGASWRRDPLGPPFHSNFIWGQRFVQISMALPEDKGPARARAIPIDLAHCPSAKKPPKNAGEDDWKAYREKQKQMKLSKCGSNRIEMLRQHLDNEGVEGRELIVSADGSYTNKEILKQLPQGVTFVGRIRKDAKLYSIPTQNHEGVGRKRVYGDRLPTPEQIRQSSNYQWQKVNAWAAGKVHEFQIKVIDKVRWRAAGEKHNLRLIVIRPLGYRLSKKSRILYRQPAYLICTNTDLNIEKLLQAYLWRWEIEVNFRDEKTLLGCGEAQVRKQPSVESVPAFIVAMYAFLLLAAHRASKNGEKITIPRPRWYPRKKNQRLTTSEIVNLLRTEMWTKALGSNFSGFLNKQKHLRSQRYTANSPISAIAYMRK